MGADDPGPGGFAIGAAAFELAGAAWRAAVLVATGPVWRAVDPVEDEFAVPAACPRVGWLAAGLVGLAVALGAAVAGEGRWVVAATAGGVAG